MKLKFCGHCGNEKLTPERRIDLRTRFDESHSKGAKQHGVRWLVVNECATNAARSLQIDYTDPLTRALLTVACYRIMTALFPEETKES